MQNVDPDFSKMMAIDVAEFLSGTILPLDIYMRLGEQKFVLIAKAGDKSHLQSHNAIKKNQVSQIWVHKSEYSRFLTQTLEIVGLTQKSKKFKMEHRTYFLRSATTAIYNNLGQFGPGPELVTYAKSVADTTVAMVENEGSLASIIKGLHMASPDVFNQAIAISAFSVMIAKQLKWQSKVTFEKLALGGLLVDIGLKELAPEIINKPRSEMTYEEIMQYEEHPYRGLKMLESIGNIPDDVLSIVYEHHENSAGMGYPRKIREIRQNPLAKIVALSAEFCELVIQTPRNKRARSANEAICHIETIMGQPFNREAFQALKILVEKDLELIKAV